MDKTAKAFVFAILIFSSCLIFSGCLTNSLKNETQEQGKLNLAVRNFSELPGLGLSLECTANVSNSSLFIRVKGGAYRVEDNGSALVKQNATLYLRVPEDKKSEFNCDWIMVNETENVYAQWLYQFNPIREDMDSLPMSNFDCRLASINDADFYPAGKTCWFFDLKTE